MSSVKFLFTYFQLKSLVETPREFIRCKAFGPLVTYRSSMKLTFNNNNNDNNLIYGAQVTFEYAHKRIANKIKYI